MERRIGFRRAVHGVSMVLPSPPARFVRRRPKPVVGRVDNLSLTGAGIVAPEHALEIGRRAVVQLDGQEGRVIVRRSAPAAEPGCGTFGVQFVGEDFTPIAVALLDVPEGFGPLANALVGLLDDLAGKLDNAAGCGTPDPDLRRVAADLSAAVPQFEVGRVNAEDIIASVCWIDGLAQTDGEPIRQWAQDVNLEIAKHPFAVRKDLARALCTVATDGQMSPLGAQVMSTLAGSLLL